MTSEPGPGGDERRVRLDLAPDDERVVVADDRAQLVARQPEPLVDLVMGAEEGDAFAGEWLDDEDLHAPTSMPVVAPIASRPARCAAATPVPGTTGRPIASRLSSMTPMAAEDLVERHRAEMADPEDEPVELRLPAGHDELARLERGVEGLPVESLGQPGACDGLGRMGRIGEPAEAQGIEARAGRGGTGGVAGEDGLGPLRVHQAHRDIELEQDAERRRERGLAGGHALAIEPGVEVEARHLRGLDRLPGARGEAQERHPGRGHPALLGAADRDVDAPGVLLERDGAEGRHAVHEDERIGGARPDRGGELADRVHDPGRGLVVGQQHGLPWPAGRQRLADDCRIGGLAPLDVDLRDVRAVDGRDAREPVAERADRHGQDLVAGRQRVDDRGLEAARARGRDEDHVVGRAEERLDPAGHPLEHPRELRPAVVDHLARPGLADRRRQARRAGDPKVGLEAVHGRPPGSAGRRG